LLGLLANIIAGAPGGVFRFRNGKIIMVRNILITSLDLICKRTQFRSRLLTQIGDIAD